MYRDYNSPEWHWYRNDPICHCYYNSLLLIPTTIPVVPERRIWILQYGHMAIIFIYMDHTRYCNTGIPTVGWQLYVHWHCIGVLALACWHWRIGIGVLACIWDRFQLVWCRCLLAAFTIQRVLETDSIDWYLSAKRGHAERKKDHKNFSNSKYGRPL